MAVTTPTQLYTAKSLFTLGGASFSVLALTGALTHVFGWSPKWLALVFAEILAFVGLALLPKENRRLGIPLLVVAFCNGLLIYTQALGFNTLNQGTAATKTKSATLVPFLDTKPWWPPADQRVAAEGMVKSARDVEQSIGEFQNAHKTDPNLPTDLTAQLGTWREKLATASDGLAGSYGEIKLTKPVVLHPLVAPPSVEPSPIVVESATSPAINSRSPEPKPPVSIGEVYEPGQSGVTRPKVTSSPKPNYPREAYLNQIQGVVKLSAIFGKNGSITDIRVVSSLDKILDAEAIKAARQIKFTPGQKDGKPANVRMPLEYNFRIY